MTTAKPDSETTGTTTGGRTVTPQPSAASTRTPTLLLVLFAALAMTGCGDLTAGGVGEIDVSLSGDAPDDASESVRATSPTLFATSPAAGEDDASRSAYASTRAEPRGDVTATLEVSVLSPQGEWIVLTDGLQEATVDIQGATLAELGRKELEPGSYDRIRVRFTDIQARVDAGLPVLGEIGVDFGDASSISVEQELGLEVEDGEEIVAVVDLNSVQWLNAAQPAQKMVAAAHVRSALAVHVR